MANATKGTSGAAKRGADRGGDVSSTPSLPTNTNSTKSPIRNGHVSKELQDQSSDFQGTNKNGDKQDASDADSDDPMAALLGSLDTHEEALNKKRKSMEPAADKARDQPAKKARISQEPHVEDGESEEEGEMHSSDEEDRASQVKPRDWAQDLPAEIWHRVFTLLDPRILGRLLAICGRFRKYLDANYTGEAPSSLAAPPGRPRSAPLLPFMKPNRIWRAARRLHRPGVPNPLNNRTELDMWQLCGAVACQFCGEKADPAGVRANIDPWHQGPGAKGVSIIFPFFVVSCGECLQEKSITELEILLSSATPSILVPGLPFVFMTTDLHMIHPQMLEANPVPSTVKVTKVYWKAQAKELKKEFDQVKNLGSAAAEEWVKGLEPRGRSAIRETERWETWATFGGLKRMQEHATSSSSPTSYASLGGVARYVRKASYFPSTPDTNNPHAQASNGPRAQSRASAGAKRSKEENETLRAERIAEIERRASLLVPPIPLAVLSHMSSFNAATQNSLPLDDNAWERLKPDLIRQRALAEKTANESAASARVTERRLLPGSGQSPAVPVPEGPAREVPDSEWDEAQGPLRALIVKYADEIIRKDWEDGDKVKRKTAAQFAAEVLLFIRQRFYAQVALEAATAIAMGNEPVVDPAEGPWTQKLTLENMKWVFDFKVRPLTEKYRKELFVCNGCKGGRPYGLEAVTQHYAAKHTTSLSHGSVVVHWRSEWPEEPVFHPDPKNAPQQPIEAADTNGGNRSQFQPQGYQGYNGYEAPYGSTGYTPFSGPPYPTPPYPGPPQQPPPGTHMYHQPMPPFLDPFANQPSAQGYPGYPYGATPYAPPAPVSYPQHPYPPSVMPLNAPNPYQTYPPPPSAPQHPDQPPAQQDVPPAPPPDPKIQQCKPIIESSVAFAWKKVGTNLKNVPSPVRAHAVLYHVAKAVRQKVSVDLSLYVFRAVAEDSKATASLRQIRGLKCQQCKNTNPMRNKFSLSELTQHFKSEHKSVAEARGWHEQMILLPNENILRALWKTLDQHRVARSFVVQALPQIAEEYARKGPPAPPSEPTTTASGTQTAPPIKSEPKSPEPVAVALTRSRNEQKAGGQDSQMSSDEELGEYRPLKRPERNGEVPNAHPAELQRTVREHRAARDELDYGADSYDARPRQVYIVDRDDRERAEASFAPRRRVVYEVPEEDIRAHSSMYGEPPRARGSRTFAYPYSERDRPDPRPARRHEEYAALPQRRRSVSPRPEESQLQYRERSPRQVRYVDDDPHYHEQPQPRYRAQSTHQEYELVEVRSPRGDYLIRRHIVPRHHEPRDVYYNQEYAPQAQPAPIRQRRIDEHAPTPAYEVSYERAGAMPVRPRTRQPPQYRQFEGVDDDGRGQRPSIIPPPRRQPSAVEAFEDYDPRYPAGHHQGPG